jgi:hypothetical protein
MKRARKVSVLGLFHDQDTLNHVVQTLQTAGFPATDISAVTPGTQSTQFAHEHHTKAPEGASIGAAIGGLLVGGLALLVGLGQLVIPGLDDLVKAGPIVAALAGVGAGAAVGWIIGALIGLSIPEYEAKRYESLVSGGGMLVSVHCDDGLAAHRARSILDGFGATGIDDMREAQPRHRAQQVQAS